MAIVRKRKSEKLTGPERRKLRGWVNKKGTKIDAAADLPCAISTLVRLLELGCGSPDTIEKVRSKINPSSQAA